MKNLIVIPVEESSQAGEARRLAGSFCQTLNFTENDSGVVALIVTELATNLARHTQGGELILRPLKCGDVQGIEILSIDKGPGMGNVARSMQDGFSTAGSSGTGLGAVLRSSSQFDIHSQPGKGTVVMSRFRAGSCNTQLPVFPLEISALRFPFPGEDVCGDNCATEQNAARSMVLVADGLGHGLDAALASSEAVTLFRKNREATVQSIVAALHAGLRSTRGAVIAVAEINHAKKIVTYSGIGNIYARIICDGVEKNLVSQNGTAGYQARKLQEFTYPWDDTSLLVMHSDGLTTHWNLDDYPQLVHCHPSVIAAVLCRDFTRGRDDVCVVVAKKSKGYLE